MSTTDGAVVARYDRQLRPLIWGIVIASLIEAVALTLLLHRWPVIAWIHVAVCVLGLGFTWWSLRGYRNNPHTLRDNTLHLRYGRRIDVPVPLDAIAAATATLRDAGTKTIGFTENTDGSADLTIGVAGVANATLRLERPIEVTIGKHGTRAVGRIHFRADDPNPLLRAINERANVVTG